MAAEFERLTAGASDLVVDLFSGPGGWDVYAGPLGLGTVLGIDHSELACKTRRAAGHPTICGDVSLFTTALLTGRVTGLVASPPCTTFSGAGKRGGVMVLQILAAAIREAMRGQDTRAARIEEMRAALRAAWEQLAAEGVKPFVGMDPERLTAEVDKAVAITALMIEPARFWHATRPEWVCMEQVPAVLPLFRVYAAELKAAGYSVWAGKLNAADYGVPQTRTRVILIASRARRVSAPPPTHYDPRKGDQLFAGKHWVSMAQALGWGATGRPVPTVTGGGTATGGAEPFGHRDRDMLKAEQDAGRWVIRPTPVTPVGEKVAMHRDRGAGLASQGGEHRDRPVDQPAPTITAADGGGGVRMRWVVRPGAGGFAQGWEQDMELPSPTIREQTRSWVLVRQVITDKPDVVALRRERGAGLLDRGGARRDHPVDEPAPTITSAGGDGGAVRLRWVLRNGTNQNVTLRQLTDPAGTLFFGARTNTVSWQLVAASRLRVNDRTKPRSMDEPAPTVALGHSDMRWVQGRPATTVQGTPRVGRPGHKRMDRGNWEAQFEQGSVQITTGEAACLQSFPPAYPFHGRKTARFQQIGNAIPPRLAAHVYAAATGRAGLLAGVLATGFVYPEPEALPPVNRRAATAAVEDGPEDDLAGFRQIA